MLSCGIPKMALKQQEKQVYGSIAVSTVIKRETPRTSLPFDHNVPLNCPHRKCGTALCL